MLRKYLYSIFIFMIIFSNISMDTWAETLSGTSDGSKTVTLVIYPNADTTANNSQKTRNYGAAETLDLRQGWGEGFMRFDLSPIANYQGTVTSAKLALTKNGDVNGKDIGINVQRVNSDSWIEGTKNNTEADTGELTWNNKPAADNMLLTTISVPGTVNTTVYGDLTTTVVSEFAGDKVLSLKLTGASDLTSGRALYYSKEATNIQDDYKPHLIVVIDISLVPDPDPVLDPNPAGDTTTLPSTPTQLHKKDVSVAVGANTSTIQAAIDSASSAGGGTVTLDSGTYTITTPILLKSNVSLAGAGKDITVLKRDPNYSMGIYGVLSSATTGGLSNVIVKNLTIDTNYVVAPFDSSTNNVEVTNYGVLIQGADGSNNKIQFDAIKVQNSSIGFHIKGTNNLTVTNSEFTKNGGAYYYWHNVYLRRVSKVLLKNNTMSYGTSGNGINISYSDNITIDSNHVYNNYFRGIRAADSSYIDTINNQVYSNITGDGIIYNSESTGVSNFRIDSNKVTGNGGNGIYISSSSSYGTVSSNEDGGSNIKGFLFNGSTSVIVKGNELVVYPEADAGVSKSNATRNYGVTNNFGLKNGYGEAFLRFDLSQLEGFPVTANVYLTTTSNSPMYAPIHIIDVDDDTWIEGTKNNATADPGELTWNNRPKAGKEIAQDVFLITPVNTVSPTKVNQTVYADVTSSVIRNLGGDQKVSFTLQSTGADYTNFWSREATALTYRPSLRVIVDRSYSFPVKNMSVQEGQPLSVTLNKQTMDGEDVALAVNGLPKGAAFDAQSATINWTPIYSQAGTYPITIMASKKGLTASAQMLITVVNVPNAPEFTPLSDISTQEGENVHFIVQATNPLGGALLYQADWLPDGATLNSETGEFNWTPSYRQCGTYNLVFSVNNGDFVSKQNGRIDVQDVNWPLLTPIEDQEVEQQQVLKLSVQGWDPEGGVIIYQAESVPSGATLDTNTGEFRWVPEPEQIGFYIIRITASNGVASSPVLQVNIAVVPQVDSNAETLYGKAEIGTKNGQFFKSAKAKLNQAIIEANQVLSLPIATPDQIDQARDSLKQAVDAFKESVIKHSTGDLNNDGYINYQDLAEIVANYGLEPSVSPSADLDGNGKIELEDLVFVAKRVTQG